MSIKSDAQSPSPGNLIDLYELDLSPLGGQTFRFVPALEEGGSIVVWKGQNYTPWPVDISGFEKSGTGTLPRPSIVVANVDKTFQALVLAYNSLRGAILTRWRTFDTYLDNGATPDENAHFEAEIYIIDRLAKSSRQFLEFELRAAVDIEGRQIPRRQVLRDLCLFTYRVWDADAGDWIDINSNPEKITCPYVGGSMFDTNDNAVTDEAQDYCSHKLSGCAARHGIKAPKPFGGFPGVTQGR